MAAGNSSLIALAHKLNCDAVRKLCDWNGYVVYEPFSTSGATYTGMPLVLLEKDNTVRISTIEESFAVTDYMDANGLLDEHGEPVGDTE